MLNILSKFWNKFKSVLAWAGLLIAGGATILLQRKKIDEQKKREREYRREIDRAKRRQQNKKRTSLLDESGIRRDLNSMFPPKHDKDPTDKP